MSKSMSRRLRAQNPRLYDQIWDEAIDAVIKKISGYRNNLTAPVVDLILHAVTLMRKVEPKK